MEPISNAGQVVYPMNVQPEQEQQMVDDYASMPMVYDEALETKKQASSNMLGLTLLGILGAAGLGYGIYKGRGVSKLNAEVKELKEAKEALEKANKELEEKLEESNKNWIQKKWSNVKNWFSKKFGKEKVEGAENEVKAEAEKASEKASEAKPAED